ncbi:hypothetical protein Xoosp13_112 [Xanthomonas phage Xoo-sp13]|nr:hypothetical protein Xoosp13_112 [Xanthomonas phage Xoo-sp13]
MKLDLFNKWRDITKWDGLTLQSQSVRKGDVYATYIRDKDSKANITFAISRESKEQSLERAIAKLRQIGTDGVRKAIQTGQMVLPRDELAPANEKDVQWRDGANHSHRAQRDIVDRERGYN